MEAYRLHMGVSNIPVTSIVEFSHMSYPYLSSNFSSTQNPRNKQNRWLKLRNSRPSKQVVVQRLLPLQPGMAQTYGVVNTNDVEYSGNSNMHDESSTSSDDRTSNNHKHASATQAKSLLTSENLDRINARHYDNNNRENVHNVNKTIDMNHLLDDNDDDEDDEDDHDNEQTNELSDGNDVDEIDADEIDGEGDGEAIDEESRRLNEDPGIQSLMEISLPSPFPAHAAADECVYPMHLTRRLSTKYTSSLIPQILLIVMAHLRWAPWAYYKTILLIHAGMKRTWMISRLVASWVIWTRRAIWMENLLGRQAVGYVAKAIQYFNYLISFSSMLITNEKNIMNSFQVDSSNLSTISETSIDYITKFEELAESMKNESPNLLMQW